MNNKNENKNGELEKTDNTEITEIASMSRMEKLLEILRFSGGLTVESMYDFSSNDVVEKVEKDRKRGSDDEYDDNMNNSSTSLLGKGSARAYTLYIPFLEL